MVMPWFESAIAALPPPNKVGKDAKTRLQEWLQARQKPLPIYTLLGETGEDRRLYFADEAGGEPAASAFRPGPALLLVGPEGGFAEEERAAIRAAPNAAAGSLGPRILRAETAALAALAAFMAVAGDWRE